MLSMGRYMGRYPSHRGEEFEKLGMLEVEERIKQLKLNPIFKIYHDEAPAYLNSHFRKFSNIHWYLSRGSDTNFIKTLGSSVQYIFLYLVFRNGTHYQIMSKHKTKKNKKNTCNSTRLSKATFYLRFKFFIWCTCFTSMCNYFCVKIFWCINDVILWSWSFFGLLH